MNKTRAQILGENLKRIRKEKGYSRIQLAEYLGVNPGAIGYYETGQREPPLNKIFKLAEYLGVSIANLIGENGFGFCVPDIDAIVDEKLFEYRYKRAIKIVTDARFTVRESDKHEFIFTPPPEIDIDSEQQISIAYNIGFAPIHIKNRNDFVQIIEDTESIALFNDKTFRKTFIERFFKRET